MSSRNYYQYSPSVQPIVADLRRTHSHLSSSQSICIVTTFPCGKPSNTFPTALLLQQNIDFYNNQLRALSAQLHITVLDFRVQLQHLSSDRLHLHRNFCHLISHNTSNYFHTLASSPPAPRLQHSFRSPAAIHHRNQCRYARRAAIQAQLYIRRAVHPPWDMHHVKAYFKTHRLPVAKISPIRKNQVRLQFNNALALHTTDSSLPKDFFSAVNFSRVFP